MEQLGFEIIFFFMFFSSSELTCGTIKGTSGSILKKLELSITTECFAAIGTYFSEILPPAEKKVISTLEKSKPSKLSTFKSLLLNFNFAPALFDEATRNSLSIEKFFFSKTSIIFLPTFPVAPTIATSMMI